ncbi:hypothetical protein KW785_03605 [Candidatus Parcubacteria bacterium]|nr:hypothetical protein [Candidatus Parcubacteria bacterium]
MIIIKNISKIALGIILLGVGFVLFIGGLIGIGDQGGFDVGVLVYFLTPLIFLAISEYLIFSTFVKSNRKLIAFVSCGVFVYLSFVLSLYLGDRYIDISAGPTLRYWIISIPPFILLGAFIAYIIVYIARRPEVYNK